MKTVLITGASSGLGNSTAQKLAGRGYKVFGTSRRAGQRIQGVEMLQMDVQDEGSVRQGVDAILVQTGQIDVLVNNAGILIVGTGEETSVAQTQQLLETNFLGAIRVMQAVLPAMRKRRNGHIINVASLGGRLGVPGEAAYSASKFALVGYSEALRHEVAPLGIHVSVVEPGFFQTNMEQSAIGPANPIADYAPIRAALESAIKHNFENGGDPGVVAAAIAGIIKTSSPKLHYPVGKDTIALQVQRFMPEAMFEVGLKRSFGLHDLSRKTPA
jgi:NAD(P)-dependent dehydrogenase (short-subunit alcohol dehydrogenase family)